MTGERVGWAVGNADNELQRALQPVTDSVRAVTGFEVAAISRLHDNQRFEYVAVSSNNEFAQQLLGRGNTLQVIEEQNRNAQKWGRFDYVPHWAQEPLAGERTWTPEIEYEAAPDAFHAEDVLSSLLRCPDGDIIGMLSLDIPTDGRQPGAEQLALMEAFATHAERVLHQALESHRVQQRLQLAATARNIVRQAAASRSLEDVLDQCRPLLMEGFGLNGLWMQFLTSSQEKISTLEPPAPMPGISLEMQELASMASRIAWAEQRVTVLTANSELTILTEEQRRKVIGYLESISVASIIFAPMGAGDEPLGNLVLTRPSGAPDWTDDELNTARELGRDLGQALLNAHLFDHNAKLLEELQTLYDYKRTLSDTIVHELKNALTSVMGHSEVIGLHDGLPDRVQSSLGAIDRATRRLSDLADNLLTLSLVSEVSDMTDQAAVDLVPLVRRASELLAVRADAKHLEVNIEAPVPGHVRGSSELLELVCSNLISNAIKYTPDYGSVTVQVRSDSEGVVLSVADTGLGISAEDQLYLFKEFFRANDLKVRQESGSGLGLAIVSRIVTQHGGTISVHSEPGRGSTFTVAFPATVG